MEKDILNYSPTVMFRGTPCIQISKTTFKRWFSNCSSQKLNFSWLIVPRVIFPEKKVFVKFQIEITFKTYIGQFS